MRSIFLLVLSVAMASTASAADPPAAPPVPISSLAADPLVGDWRVDLTAQPEDSAGGRYFTVMTITSIADDRIAGTFYGSVIENGRINRRWGAIRFAFMTRDGGGGAYHHSGELVDGRYLRGLSHAIDRDFLSIWTAERGRPDDETP